MTDKRAFFKLDVGYLMNPKVAAVAIESPAAVLLHIAAMGYAAQHLTDGVVPLALVMRIAGATKDDAELLFKHSLLVDRHDGDAEVHDYLEHQRSASQAKRAEVAGQIGAHARWHADRTADGNADRIAEGTAEPMRHPMPREREEREIKTAPRKRGTRIPDDFTVTDDMATWARAEVPGVDIRWETTKFVDYWQGVPGAKGVKLDWVGTWRNWMRRQIESRPAATESRPVVLDQWRQR